MGSIVDIIGVPAARGLTEEELVRYIQTGYHCLGILPIVEGHGIATPSNPLAGLPQPVIVLVRMEPSVPLPAFIKTLQDISVGKVSLKQVLESLTKGMTQ